MGGAGHRSGPAVQGQFQQNIARGAGRRVGAAAGDLDHAVGLPEGRRGQQRHRARADGRRPALPGGDLDDARRSRRAVRPTASSATSARADLVERVETWLENPVFGDMLVENVYTEYRDANGVMYPAQVGAEARRPADVRAADRSASAPTPTTSRRWSRRRRRRPAAAAVRRPGGPGRRRRGPDVGEARRRRVPHQRRLQRAGRRVRRSHPALRARPAERGAGAGDHRRDEEGDPEQADPLRRDLAPPLRSHRRHCRGGGRGHHHRHADGQQGVPRARAVGAAHAGRRDALSKSGKKPIVEGFTGDKRVFQDATRTVEIHVIKGLPHADGLVVAYLPKEKILVYADMFNLPPANGPGAEPAGRGHDGVRRQHRAAEA